MSLGAYALGFALTWMGFARETSTLAVHADVIENCDVHLTADSRIELHCNSRILPIVRLTQAEDGARGFMLLLVNF